jgi:hypothetical protein
LQQKSNIQVDDSNNDDKFTFSPNEKDDDNDWEKLDNVRNKRNKKDNDDKDPGRSRTSKSFSIIEISSQEFAKVIEKSSTKNENKNNNDKKKKENSRRFNFIKYKSKIIT